MLRMHQNTPFQVKNLFFFLGRGHSSFHLCYQAVYIGTGWQRRWRPVDGKAYERDISNSDDEMIMTMTVMMIMMMMIKMTITLSLTDNIARLAWPKGYNVLPMSLSFIFLLTVLLCSPMSQNVLDRSAPNFQDRYAYSWAWSIRRFRGCSRDTARITDYWRETAKTGIPHLRSLRRHSTTNGRIATWMHSLTPPMTPVRLVKIWWTLIQ